MLIMKNFIHLVFVTSLIFFSCGKQTTKDTTTAKDTVAKKETVKEVEKKPSLLEGNWVSTQDVKSQIQVTSGNWIETYDKEKPDTFKFGLGDSCLANPGAKTNPNGKYITVFDSGDYRCFYIIDVNDSKLDLSYVGRGNTLSYKRKK
jgi:hypothetical protein